MTPPLSYFLAIETQRDLLRVDSARSQHALLGPHFGLTDYELLPLPPDELLNRAYKAKEVYVEIISSPSLELLDALSRIQTAAESCRAAYSRGFSYPNNLLDAVRNVSQINAAVADALASLKILAEGE